MLYFIFYNMFNQRDFNKRNYNLTHFSYDIYISFILKTKIEMLSHFIISCAKSSPVLNSKLLLSSSYFYSNNSYGKGESNPFHLKILQITNQNQLFTFCKQNQAQFNDSSYTVAARTLGKIFLQTRIFNKLPSQQLNQLKQFILKLKQTNIKDLTSTQIMNLLNFTRVLKSKNISTFQVRLLLSTLKAQVSKIVPRIAQDANELYQLGYYYHQLCILDIKQSNILAQKLVTMIQKQKVDSGINPLTTNIILQIASGMKNKSFFNYHQKNLLEFMIKKINQQLISKISYFQLVKIGGYLNEIIAKISDRSDTYNVSQIFNKILTNIDELDEKSIMFILSGELTHDRTYKNIYNVILQKVFDQIQTSGQSSFSQNFTIRILTGISSKIKLFKASQKNQQKFFAFMRESIPKNPKYISSYVIKMIQNNFLGTDHLQRLVKILQSVSSQFNIPIYILHEISCRNVNLKGLLRIQMEKISQLKGENLLMFGQILKTQLKFNKQNKKIEQAFQIIQNTADTLIDTPQKFSDFIFKINNKSKLKAINIVFKKQLIEKVNKWFLANSAGSTFRNAFIYSLVFGNHPQTIQKKYRNIIKQLQIDDLSYLLKAPFKVINESKWAVANILFIIAEKIDVIINDKTTILNLAKLLSNNFSEFENIKFQNGKRSFWAIIKKVLSSKESEIIKILSGVIRKIFRSQYYEFKNSLQYIEFIQQLLQHQQNLVGFKLIYVNLIDEAIKMSLLTKNSSLKIPIQILDQLPKRNKIFIQIIQNEQSEVNIWPKQQLNLQMLYLHFVNLHADNIKLVASQKLNILNYIQNKMNAFEAFQCILHFRFFNVKQFGKQIFDALISNILSKVKNFNAFNIFGICQTVRRNKKLHYNRKVQEYFRKALQYFSIGSNLNKLSFEEHIFLIKRANQVNVINSQYMKNVLYHYRDGHYYYNFKQLILTYARMNYVFSPQQLQLLKRNDFFSGTNSFGKSIKLFLLLEKIISDPKVTLKNIIQKSKSQIQIKNVLGQIELKHLQEKYPEQTAGWQPELRIKSYCQKIGGQQGQSLILAFKDQIQKICKQPLEEKNVYNNFYYKIRSTALVFVNNNKYQRQNQLLIELLEQFSGQKDCKFVILNSKSIKWSLLRHIDKQCPELFSQEEKSSFEYKKFKKDQQQEEHDHFP